MPFTLPFSRDTVGWCRTAMTPCETLAVAYVDNERLMLRRPRL